MNLRIAALALVLAGGLSVPCVASAQDASKGPDTVVFTPKRGNVTFTHAKHAQASECKACHHESKPEKPATAENAKCSSCHTTPATEPMKTTLRLAMHNTAEQAGTCYNCHKAEAEKGKKVPAECNDCHKLDG